MRWTRSPQRSSCFMKSASVYSETTTRSGRSATSCSMSALTKRVHRGRHARRRRSTSEAPAHARPRRGARAAGSPPAPRRRQVDGRRRAAAFGRPARARGPATKGRGQEHDRAAARLTRSASPHFWSWETSSPEPPHLAEVREARSRRGPRPRARAAPGPGAGTPGRPGEAVELRRARRRDRPRAGKLAQERRVEGAAGERAAARGSTQVSTACCPSAIISSASARVGRSQSGKSGTRPRAAHALLAVAPSSSRNRSPNATAVAPRSRAAASAFRHRGLVGLAPGTATGCAPRRAAARPRSACARSSSSRTACIATRSKASLIVVSRPDPRTPCSRRTWRVKARCPSRCSRRGRALGPRFTDVPPPTRSRSPPRTERPRAG